MGPDESDSSDGAQTSGSTTTDSEDDLLQLVLGALGGEESIANLATVRLDVEGEVSITDEGPTLGSPAPANDFTATIRIDTTKPSMRLDVERVITFEGFGAPQTFSEIIDGELGAVEGIESLFQVETGAMLSDRWAATVRQQELLNPHLVLQRVVDEPLLATDAGTADDAGVTYRLLVIEDAVSPLTLWVEPDTGVIARATTLENHHLRRDVEIEITYADWLPTRGGPVFPHRVDLAVDGTTVRSETRNDVIVAERFSADTFAFPEGVDPQFVAEDAHRGARSHQFHQMFSGIGIQLDGLQTAIVAEEFGAVPGVYHLTGGTHHSVVVQQSAGVVVFEAPLYAARCEAIVDWIEQTMPGLPLTHVVVSHAHMDHAACARTFVAAGAELVVGPATTDWWTELLNAPSTVEPDAMALAGAIPKVIVEVPAGGSLALADAVHPIRVYDLPAEHAEDLVLPVVEDIAAGFVVDLYSPGFPSQFVPGGAAEILDGLEAHGLTGSITLFPGAHGFGIATLADLEAAAAEHER